MLVSLATARARQDNWEEAAILCRRALRIEENVAGPLSSQRAITLTEYAMVLRHQGQKRRASELEKESRALYPRLRKAAAPATVDISELR